MLQSNFLEHSVEHTTTNRYKSPLSFWIIFTMPAINLPRLREQVNQLAEYFDKPDVFVSALQEILEFYADRSYKPGQSGTPPPLSPSYNVPKPVLRHIILILKPLIESQPNQALELCDELWQESYIEFRTLTAFILGLIPSDYAEMVLDRIERWGRMDIEEQVFSCLMQDGLGSIRRGAPDSLLTLVETWMSSSETTSQQMGLRAISPMLDNPDFENLPVFYRLLKPYVRSVSSDLRLDVLEVIKDLARHSPKETAYFLKQNLELSDSKDTAWMIRNSLNEFPESSQNNLRIAIRNKQ